MQFKQILKRLRTFKLQVKVTLVLFSTKDFKNSLFLTECMFLSYLQFFFNLLYFQFLFFVCVVQVKWQRGLSCHNFVCCKTKFSHFSFHSGAFYFFKMFLTKFEVSLVRRTSILLPVDEDLYSARVNGWT